MSLTAALPSPQHPKESDDAKRKIACGGPNSVEQKAGLKSDLIPAGVKGLIITSLPRHVPDDEIQCECIISPLTKAKVVNAPGYPARIPKPRRTGLYKVGSTPGMGKGVFATCDIKRGELILAERPLIVEATLPPGLVINESTIDRQILTEYETVLEAAIDRLPPESQHDFKALHSKTPLLELGVTSSKYESFLEGSGLPPMSLDEFETSCNPGGELFRITRANRYAFSQLDCGPEMCSAVYKIASRINHSCTPNVLFYTKLSSLSVQFYVIRDIKAGEQLFSSYGDTNTNRLQRRSIFAHDYHFVCQCPACVHATPKSDRLRETFVDRIDCFKMALTVKQSPSNLRILLENALALETDMLEEGLDSSFKFGTLLQIICVAFSRLGKGPESAAYLSLVMEFRFSLKEHEE